TPSSATSRDSDGKTAWYYFCTKFVPFVLTQKERDYHRVSHVLSVLVQHDALRAHEEATNESGMGLIVKECLQQNSSHYGRYGCIQLLGSILFEVISTANRAELDMRHPELVRLLIWSMLGPVENLFQKLLEFGADIHAASMYYGDDSAMDCYLRSRTEIAPGVTELLLAHAQADLIPKTDPRGWLKHFCLCAPQPGTTDRESTRVVKLEAILKIGVDPNARSKTLTTAAMVAAGAGSLDVLRLLVLHNADMDLTDEFDWTVVQHAVWGGQVDVLKYLHSQIQGGEQWTQLVSFLVPLGAAAMPMGPSDARSYFGCTLAHFASYRPEMATLQFLKEAGVLGDINARAQEGVTPLHLAVCVKAPAATRWLIRNGADVKATFGMKKSTALHTAFRMGNAENAFALLEAGAELSTDSTGMTPERYGSRSVLYDLLRLISYSPVKIPRAIHQALKQERTGSLYSAIVSGNLEACRSIAQVTMVLNKPLAECGTCTPLIVALVWQRPDIARLFLELGASTSGTPCARTRSSGPSRHKTLYIAISQPIFNSILEQLLERSLVDEAHWTQDAEFGLPLHLAAAFNPAGLKILVEHLVKHGIFFSRERNSRWIYQKAHSFSKMLLGSRSPAGPFVPGQWLVPSGTPLHVAAWNRKLEAVDVLLDLGVDVDARDNGGWTPLHHATKVGCVDTISKLLQRGATPRACDRIGRTPLMILVCTGTLKAVAIMVALETDKTSADVNGKTALHYAVLAWRLDVLIYLIKMGWDAYQLDKSGRSPVCYALSSPRLASYIYATHLDLTHLVSKSGNISTVKLSPSTNSTRSFYRYLPQTAVVQYLKSLLDGVSTPLMSFAFLSQTQGMRILIESGAELEDRNRSGDTALIVACREGQLPSVVFLVRQGAKLEYTYDSRLINALKSASSHAGVIKWFLVDRWADQDKLTSEPFNSEAPAPLRPWTGVRTVKIPLRGTFARPVGSSLMIHAKYLHSIARNGWRNMVPLGWNTVAHLVPLPAE
ncbi:ankyrin, partial [Ophiobolus disseminans]